VLRSAFTNREAAHAVFGLLAVLLDLPFNAVKALQRILELVSLRNYIEDANKLAPKIAKLLSSPSHEKQRCAVLAMWNIARSGIFGELFSPPPCSKTAEQSRHLPIVRLSLLDDQRDLDDCVQVFC
jgi:hypothetical protein